MNSIVQTILIGIGATLTMDGYALILKILGVKSLDYQFVGRWIGHFPNGKFFHQKITDAPPVSHEQILGWIAHYLIGITFAFLLLFVFGEKWFQTPTFTPALLVGIITIIAPFFLMQPAFGFGIAGSNLPDPNKARLMSLITHSVYGSGLYLSTLILNQITKLF
ncbi:DUF2938 domain-containing protein [Ancylomarina salipaludis]|uniref:DUF2938 domain-containing protein n=1 Tax=Ancylomarina salipaludis TaxID=2501299 RepID=A0A4Q1JP28_9BACT|nr:DUF2938 domain-containing protein [Ancylomarina salipaludis]RXQ95861.1 DUF2938 domain-containing protein [Ancylomarina salipaludis]